MDFNLDDYALCYVSNGIAYFTTQKLSEQWGDDWNDAPYEHNAETPYEYDPNRYKDKKPWKILKIAFLSDLITPDYNCANSSFSVQGINAGQIAWLRSHHWQEEAVAIMAGTSPKEFIEKIEKNGGEIFLPKGFNL